MAGDDEGRMEELTRRGRAAAIALGRRLGLPAAEPVVLSSRGNLLLHFAPGTRRRPGRDADRVEPP